MATELSANFPTYTEYDPEVPVWCVTPEHEGCFHRFFDTSPISPSGRYLAVTRYPFQDRTPTAGEPAEIVLVDLETGATRILAETCGADTQLGAQAQWGADDTQLFFNDMDTDTWRPYGVRMNPLTGDTQQLEGTVYMVSPNGRWAASPCLLRTGLTQLGYGVIAPPEHVPHNDAAAEDDGLYITDTESGKCKLLVSYREIAETATPPFKPAEWLGGDFYGFHVKWNPQGTRLSFVVRWLPREGGRMRASLIAMNADGSDIHVAMPASVWTVKGGHHPNWCPDGEYCMMNLKLDGENLRLVKHRYDGSDCHAMTEAVIGSGHPSMHPDERHIVTDSYLREPVAFGDGTTPIRWIDLAEETATDLVRIQTLPEYEGPKRERRVDPHPAWDYDFKRIAFNACPDGRRGVYIADVSGLLD